MYPRNSVALIKIHNVKTYRMRRFAGYPHELRNAQLLCVDISKTRKIWSSAQSGNMVEFRKKTVLALLFCSITIGLFERRDELDDDLGIAAILLSMLGFTQKKVYKRRFWRHLLV